NLSVEYILHYLDSLVASVKQNPNVTNSGVPKPETERCWSDCEPLRRSLSSLFITNNGRKCCSPRRNQNHLRALIGSYQPLWEVVAAAVVVLAVAVTFFSIRRRRDRKSVV